jgi:hypothetical protein
MGNKAFLHGNGGGSAAGLNYRIVSNPKPGNPKENDIWVDTDIPITSHHFSPVAPARVSENKNLLVHPYYSGPRTDNGVTYAVSPDGAIALSGTAGAVSYFNIAHADEDLTLAPGVYHISGCPAGGGDSTYNIAIGISYDNWRTRRWVNDHGNGATFTLTDVAKVSCNIGVQSGVSTDGLVFRPQLERGDTRTDFVRGTATGQVWISTGSSSIVAFNALKENGIRVFPLSAKQCVDGVWEGVPVQTYQGGEWTEWYDGELYSYGNEYEDLTGGWALSTEHSTPTHSDTLTKNADSMTFETHFVAGESYAGGFLRTNKKISLSGINFLILTVRSVSFDDAQYPFILCVKSGDNAKKEGIVASAALAPSGEQTFTLDVSALSDSYFIGIEADSLYGGKVEVLKFAIK